MTDPAPPKKRKVLLWVGFAVAVVVLLGVVPIVLFAAMGDDDPDYGLVAEPADFVGNNAGIATTGATTFKNGLGVLAGPHFGLRYSSLDVSRTLDLQYQAAPGHEFLVLAADPATLADAPAPGDDVKAALVVDGRSRPVKFADLQSGSGLVVSVPLGHSAQLTVTDTGRPQTLDLRTGRRITEIQGYYPERALNLGADKYAESGETSSGGCRRQTTMSIYFSGTGTAVLPWGPDGGWAKPGRAWLPVEYTMLINPTSVPDYDSVYDMPPSCARDLNFQLDLQRSFTVEYDGGSSAPVKADTRMLLFDVPLTMAGGALVVNPVGTYDDGSPHPVVWSQPPPAGRITLAAAK